MRAILLALLLAGCGTTKWFGVERVPPNFETPAPAVQRDYEWIVITKDNVDEVMAQLEREGVVVLFALSPDGYSAQALNTAELRRYIQQQSAVTAAYRNYLEEE